MNTPVATTTRRYHTIPAIHNLKIQKKEEQKRIKRMNAVGHSLVETFR
jgi:hypothetical protein